MFSQRFRSPTRLSMRKMKYKSQLLIFCILIVSTGQAEDSANETDDPDDGELEAMNPLYAGNSVKELLNLCKNLKASEFYTEPDKKLKQCPEKKNCIKHCNEKRISRLRDAQKRVEKLLDDLTDFHIIFWQFFPLVIVILLGAYLTFVKQFNWRTLPIIGNEFEDDPTNGYRYGHYMWMKWIILDSSHPKYYVNMTEDTPEVEYRPQSKEEMENDVEEDESDDNLHPPWDVRTICDMTADPSERLNIYFKRVQLKYQVSKPTKRVKAYRKYRKQEGRV